MNDRNLLRVPEIRHYAQEVLEGVAIITYEVRSPGAQDWHSVRLVRLRDNDQCAICGKAVPISSLSGGVCVPCFHPGGD